MSINYHEYFYFILFLFLYTVFILYFYFNLFLYLVIYLSLRQFNGNTEDLSVIIYCTVVDQLTYFTS